MAKGISVATGMVVAGLLGAVLFTSTIPPAVMNFIGEGTNIQENSDYSDFVDGLEKVCSGKKQSYSGAVALYDGSIEFTNPGRDNSVSAVFIKGSETQSETEINCPVKNANQKVLKGTAQYTIGKTSGKLVVQIEE